MNSGPGHCGRPRPPTASFSVAATTSSSRHSPSRLPLRRGGRMAWRVDGSDALTAVVVSSELRRIGEFECSDELLNQLHRNVVWGLRGNFLDCPPTARNATSGSAGPETSPSSHPLRPTSSTSTISFATGWRTWLQSNRPPTDGAPRCARRPEVHRKPSRTGRSLIPPRSGAMPLSGCHGRCGGHTGIGKC